MQKRLVDVVNDYCLRELGVLPDLINPQGYNDKVNWLKIHDQMPEHVICCDKLRAREYVADRIGRNCLLEVYQRARSVGQIDFNTLPERYVLKTNHDSGSVYIVCDEKTLRQATNRIRKSIKQSHGLVQGEWAYAHIPPQVFAEELMLGPTTDYKFHCCSGEIRWVQIVVDRASPQPRETIVDEDYAPLPFHFNYKNLLETEPPAQPAAWNRMKLTARTLSQSFRYVRVDLYAYGNRPVFGELTFWPLGGLCKTKDEGAFGRLLDFDTTYKRPMIHKLVEGRERGGFRRVADRIRRELRSMAGAKF